MTTGNNTEVADTDQEISLVDRLRLGGPNAMEVAGEAADRIETLEYMLTKRLYVVQEDGTLKLQHCESCGT